MLSSSSAISVLFETIKPFMEMFFAVIVYVCSDLFSIKNLKPIPSPKNKLFIGSYPLKIILI